MRARLILMTVVFLVAATGVFAPGSLACEPPYVISSDFTLTEDIYVGGGDAFIIVADGITFDGNGHKVIGSGSGSGVVVIGQCGVRIQNLIIQEHTRPEQRALDMGKILAYGGIGTIIGPWLAGVLSEQVNISAPYFASGLLMVIAAAALTPLRLHKKA